VTSKKLAAAIAMRRDPAMRMHKIAKASPVSRPALDSQLGPELGQEQVARAA
jgi:hypothetical protein